MTETVKFDQLGLAPELLKALIESGYTTPTPIQAQAIPLALAGGDLMAGDLPPSCDSLTFSMLFHTHSQLVVDLLFIAFDDAR